MAHFIDGADCMKSEWTLLSVALLFVFARLYTRLFVLRQKLGLSEWILIIAAIDGIGLITCDTLTYEMGVMDNYQTSVKLSKISFASNYFYDTGMGFPKLSMLAFYWSYFHLGKGSVMRKVLWGMTIFVCVCYLTILFDDTFYCGKNVSVQWSQAEGACSVFYAPPPFYLNTALNIACYLVVYSVPVILVVQGVLPCSIGLGVTFFLGALTVASTVVRFATLEVNTGQPNLVYPLSMLEMALALTVVSLPGLKPLIERHPKATRVEMEDGQLEHESTDVKL